MDRWTDGTELHVGFYTNNTLNFFFPLFLFIFPLLPQLCDPLSEVTGVLLHNTEEPPLSELPPHYIQTDWMHDKKDSLRARMTDNFFF